MGVYYWLLSKNYSSSRIQTYTSQTRQPRRFHARTGNLALSTSLSPATFQRDRNHLISAGMEALGAVANVVAIVDMSAKVVMLRSWYLRAVAGAKDDTSRLQIRVWHLGMVLQSSQRVIVPDSGALVTSREVK